MGDASARVDVLGGLPLFAKLSPDLLSQVAGLIEETQVPADTDVVTEGDAADALWVLVDGEIRVTAGDSEIRTLGAPYCFGEVGTMTGMARIATVSTTAPSTLWRIPSDGFLDLIGRPSEQ